MLNIGSCVKVMVFAIAGVAMAASARAADPAGADALLGNWEGSALVKGRPMAVTLAVTTVKLGARGAKLHFGAPRSCEVTAEYAGFAEGSHSFTYGTGNGGYCRSLRNGALRLSMDDADTLTYHGEAENKIARDDGVLKRAK